MGHARHCPIRGVLGWDDTTANGRALLLEFTDAVLHGPLQLANIFRVTGCWNGMHLFLRTLSKANAPQLSTHPSFLSVVLSEDTTDAVVGSSHWSSQIKCELEKSPLLPSVALEANSIHLNVIQNILGGVIVSAHIFGKLIMQPTPRVSIGP